MKQMDGEREDDDLTFTLGSGRQSAICGGVLPMKLFDPSFETDPIERALPEALDAHSRPGSSSRDDL